MRKKYWIVTVLALLLALCLAGCEEPLEVDEVRQQFEQEHPGVAFTLGQDCEETEQNGESLRVWTARRDEEPQLEFHIYSVGTEGLFGPAYHQEDDYSSTVGAYWLEQYPGDKEGLFQLEQGQDGRALHMQVGVYYQDRAGIAPACQRLKAFSDYLMEKDPAAGQWLAVASEEEITLPWQPIEEKDTFAHCRWLPGDADPLDFAQLEEKALTRYAMAAGLHRLGMDQFTPEEIQQALTGEEGGRPFTVVTPAGEVLYWQDLAERHYGGLCFGTMYEVLNRLQWPGLTGNAYSFSFPGADGSVYEFSYAFNDAEYTQNDWGVNTGFYYLKDGQQLLLEAPFYNYMFPADFAKLTGLQFAEGWLTQEQWQQLAEEAASAPRAESASASAASV